MFDGIEKADNPYDGRCLSSKIVPEYIKKEGKVANALQALLPHRR